MKARLTVLVDYAWAILAEDAPKVLRSEPLENGAFVFHTPDGLIEWAALKEATLHCRVEFQVEGVPATFYLGPDIFPGSYALAWLTHEEVRTGEYLDNRVRSNNKDDFLSRIRSLKETS